MRNDQLYMLEQEASTSFAFFFFMEVFKVDAGAPVVVISCYMYFSQMKLNL